MYPYGATLNVARPAVAVLSTGSVSFPAHRPVCALYHQGRGKLAVLGSGHMFDDTYMDKEDNAKIRDVIFTFLTEEFALHAIDAEDPEVRAQYKVT